MNDPTMECAPEHRTVADEGYQLISTALIEDARRLGEGQLFVVEQVVRLADPPRGGEVPEEEGAESKLRYQLLRGVCGRFVRGDMGQHPPRFEGLFSVTFRSEVFKVDGVEGFGDTRLGQESLKVFALCRALEVYLAVPLGISETNDLLYNKQLTLAEARRMLDEHERL